MGPSALLLPGAHLYVWGVADLEALVREQPLFAGLNSKEIAFLASQAKEVEFDPREVIFEEEAPAAVFYVLLEGEASLELRRRTVPFTIQTFRPGDLIGLSWLYPPHRWALTAVAEHSCRALAFDGEMVRKECEVNHEMGYRLYGRFLEVAGKRLQATRLALIELGRSY